MSARDEPAYMLAARYDARNGHSTSPGIVRELVARIDRDAAALKAAQPEVIGYVVVGKSSGSLDWDDKLFPSEEACIDSLCGPYQDFTREPASERYWGNEYKLCPVLSSEVTR